MYKLTNPIQGNNDGSTRPKSARSSHSCLVWVARVAILPGTATKGAKKQTQSCELSLDRINLVTKFAFQEVDNRTQRTGGIAHHRRSKQIRLEVWIGFTLKNSVPPMHKLK